MMFSYADDIVVYCSDIESMLELIQETKSFCDIICAALNWETSCGFWYCPRDFAPEYMKVLVEARFPENISKFHCSITETLGLIRVRSFYDYAVKHFRPLTFLQSTRCNN